MKALSYLLVLFVLALGCERRSGAESAQTPHATPAHAVDASRSAPAKPSGPTAPTAPEEKANEHRTLRLEGTPHDEEHTKITLRWKKSGPVPLFRSAGVVSSKSGQLDASAGEEIAWRKSVVIIEEPTRLTATQATTLGGASFYDPRTGQLAQEQSVLEVPEGGEVFLYKYAGEGTCFLSYSGATYLAGCPGEDAFSEAAGRKTQPPMQWWVQIEAPASSGWMEVDEDVVKVEVSSTM